MVTSTINVVTAEDLISPFLREPMYDRVSGEVALHRFSRLSQCSLPFTVSLRGSVEELERPEPTRTGGMKQSFKLVDLDGNWLSCCATGRHASSQQLQSHGVYVLYFARATMFESGGDATVWLFNEAFAFLVQEGGAKPPMQQVLLGR